MVICLNPTPHHLCHIEAKQELKWQGVFISGKENAQGLKLLFCKLIVDQDKSVEDSEEEVEDEVDQERPPDGLVEAPLPDGQYLVDTQTRKWDLLYIADCHRKKSICELQAKPDQSVTTIQQAIISVACLGAFSLESQDNFNRFETLKDTDSVQMFSV